MGGGGGDPSEPGYRGMHLDYHAWLATGDDIGEDATWDMSNITGGVAGMILDSDATSLGGSPYSFITAFDPRASGNRFPELMEEADEFFNSLEEVDPKELWEERRDVLIGKTVDSTLSQAKTDATENLKTNQDDRAVAELDKASKAFYSFEQDMFQVVKGLNTHLLTRESAREEVHAQKDLLLDLDVYNRDISGKLAIKLMDRDNTYLSRRAQSIAILAQSTDIWSTAVRQRIEDELRLTIEDATWDLRLQDFSAKALSSISGASVIPEGRGKENTGVLGTLSTLATIGGALAFAI